MRAPEYVVIFEYRRCAHEGCPRTVTHFACRTGEEGGPVWCSDHADEARVRSLPPPWRALPSSGRRAA